MHRHISKTQNDVSDEIHDWGTHTTHRKFIIFSRTHLDFSYMLTSVFIAELNDVCVTCLFFFSTKLIIILRRDLRKKNICKIFGNLPSYKMAFWIDRVYNTSFKLVTFNFRQVYSIINILPDFDSNPEWFVNNNMIQLTCNYV